MKAEQKYLLWPYLKTPALFRARVINAVLHALLVEAAANRLGY